MRRELASYEAGVTGGRQRLFEFHETWRQWEFALLRHRLKRIDTGSHTWHLLQHRLSRMSSVGVELRMRSWFYTRSLPSCGPGLCVFPDTTVHYPANVSVGTEVFINRGVTITAPAPISIGDKVLIGPYTVINSGNHRFARVDRPIREQGHDLAPIHIQDDVWIGAQATVLAGTTVGHGAVVAAGAVVTRDVAPHSVVAGVPARLVSRRGMATPGPGAS